MDNQAIIIQCFWRSCIARKSVARSLALRREGYRELVRNESASIIQGQWREKRGSRAPSRERSPPEAAAITLQAWWRRTAAVATVARMKAERQLVNQSELERYSNQCATLIQDYWKFKKVRHACIRIQCWWRRCQARQLTFKLKVARTEQYMLLKEEERRLSSITIQKAYRGHSGRRQVTQLHSARRRQGAIVIQCCIRRFLARREARRHAEEIQNTVAVIVRNEAARDIQKVWRGYTVRRALEVSALEAIEFLNRAATKIQSVTRMHLSKKKGWNIPNLIRDKLVGHFAVRIQKSFRGHASRKETAALAAGRAAARVAEHQAASALRVQSSWRSYAARKRTLKSLTAIRAAVKLQRWWVKIIPCLGAIRTLATLRREERRRLKYEWVQNASTTIQKYERRRQACSEVGRRRQRREEEITEKEHRSLTLHSCITLQRVVRGFLTRMKYRLLLKRQYAAITIQGMLKVKRAKERAAVRKKVDHTIYEINKQEDAIILMQKSVRGFLVRKRAVRMAGEFSLKTDCATIIQTAWRGVRARRALGGLRVARGAGRADDERAFGAVTLARWWRGIKGRRLFQEYLAYITKIISIQLCWKCYKSRAIAGELRAAKELRRSAAENVGHAVAIQRVFRGFLRRRDYKEYQSRKRTKQRLLEFNLEVIQRVGRGYMERQVALHDKRRSLGIIQLFARGLVSAKLASQKRFLRLGPEALQKIQRTWKSKVMDKRFTVAIESSKAKLGDIKLMGVFRMERDHRTQIRRDESDTLKTLQDKRDASRLAAIQATLERERQEGKQAPELPSVKEILGPVNETVTCTIGSWIEFLRSHESGLMARGVPMAGLEALCVREFRRRAELSKQQDNSFAALLGLEEELRGRVSATSQKRQFYTWVHQQREERRQRATSLLKLKKQVEESILPPSDPIDIAKVSRGTPVMGLRDLYEAMRQDAMDVLGRPRKAKFLPGVGVLKGIPHSLPPLRAAPEPVEVMVM